MTDEPIPFLLLRLQARRHSNSKWIDIWPAQFEEFQKLGCEIRIIELSPGEPPISPQYAAELGRQVDELEAESAEQRQALQELYEFCCSLNDFRPDSKLGRKVKSILFNLTGEHNGNK